MPRAAALVPLCTPYLGTQAADLEPALQMLLQGRFSGERRLLDGRSHPYELRWSGAAAPAEPSSCELQFPRLPAVQYSFMLPTQRLLRGRSSRYSFSTSHNLCAAMFVFLHRRTFNLHLFFIGCFITTQSDACQMAGTVCVKSNKHLIASSLQVLAHWQHLNNW